MRDKMKMDDPQAIKHLVNSAMLQHEEAEHRHKVILLFDCPGCKHKTASVITQQAVVCASSTMIAPDLETRSGYGSEPEERLCLTCGKTYISKRIEHVWQEKDAD